MLECQSNPLKARTKPRIHLSPVKFRATKSARFLNSHGTLTSSNVLTDLSTPAKTSCGYVNMAKKAEKAH